MVSGSIIRKKRGKLSSLQLMSSMNTNLFIILSETQKVPVGFNFAEKILVPDTDIISPET